jgi:hypothetical protein
MPVDFGDLLRGWTSAFGVGSVSCIETQIRIVIFKHELGWLSFKGLVLRWLGLAGSLLLLCHRVFSSI